MSEFNTPVLVEVGAIHTTVLGAKTAAEPDENGGQPDDFLATILDVD